MAMTVDPETASGLRQQLNLLNTGHRYASWKWDAVFWVTAIFIVAGAADITRLLFAGDWDFWTDWKDFQFWPVISPFAFIIIPSTLQHIQWLAWRFPTGFTYTACCLFLASWIGRVASWEYFLWYPLNFVWPATIVPAGIICDWIMLKTKSFLLTSFLGAGAFTFIWYISNYVTVAPFLQPTDLMGYTVTIADVQGFEYLRTQTPIYIRNDFIENGSLRTFLGEIIYTSMFMGWTVAVIGYWIGQGISRFFAIAPIGKFMPNL